MALMDQNNSGGLSAVNDQPGSDQAGIGIDVTTASFMADVIEASQHQPVVVDFWAPWCGPCLQLMPVLEKCIAETNGAVKLAKVNIDENQAVAAQLRVQSVPTVYAFYEGRPVDGFAGAQPESAIREFVSKLTALAGDAPDTGEILAMAEEAFGLKNFPEAAALFNQVLAMDEENSEAMAGLLRCLIGTGEYDDAQAMINALTDEMRNTDAVNKAAAALAIAKDAAENAGQLATFEAAVAANPEDPEALYNLAVGQFGAGQTTEAIETLLKVIKIDRAWNDDAGRLKLLEIFDALGPTAPEVMDGRRKLSSILFA